VRHRTRSCASSGAKFGLVTIVHLALRRHSSEENTASVSGMARYRASSAILIIDRRWPGSPREIGEVIRWRRSRLCTRDPASKPQNPIRRRQTPARWLIILPAHHEPYHAVLGRETHDGPKANMDGDWSERTSLYEEFCCPCPRMLLFRHPCVCPDRGFGW
jgi:hypothetical protein